MRGVETTNSRRGTAEAGWLRKGDLGGICCEVESKGAEEDGKLVGEVESWAMG